MLAIEQRIDLKNVLYLTDFSDCAKAALPYAQALAFAHGGKVVVLHALVPDAMACMTPELTGATITLQEQEAKAKLKEIGSDLDGQPHETLLDEARGIWAAAEDVIASKDIDVVVLGTHARKGPQRFFLGSVAEEILHRSDVPVLIVGPFVPESANLPSIFREMLVASDFSAESHRAVESAVRIARANRARITLLHVIKTAAKARVANVPGQSVANALGRLHDQFPADLQLEARPDFVVQYGVPAERIVQTAEKVRADVIILGVRSTVAPIGLTTHIEQTTTHRVVALAPCPVLMIPS